MRKLLTAAVTLLLIAGISLASEGEPPLLSVVRQSVEPHLRERSAGLFDAYRRHLAAAPQPLRTVVYTCDKDRSCGGLGDRFKGFVSAAVLAILLDADFRAYWEQPVPIHKIFETAPDTLLNLTSARERARNGTQFTFLNIHAVPAELHRLRNMDVANEFKGRLNLFVRFNGALWDHFIHNDFLWPVADRYGLHRLSKRQLFEMVMQHYIRAPTRQLSGVVARATRRGAPPRPGQLALGVQLRLGGHKLNDPPRYLGTIPEAVGCFADTVLRLCRPACNVFLTSDNDEAQALFLAAMAARNVSTSMHTGAILHLEHNRGHSSQHLKTFADWVALTRVHFMVASRSGFADTASWYCNVPAVTLVQASPCMFASGPELPLGTDPT